jgi:hypothetical protein
MAEVGERDTRAGDPCTVRVPRQFVIRVEPAA